MNLHHAWIASATVLSLVACSGGDDRPEAAGSSSGSPPIDASVQPTPGDAGRSDGPSESGAVDACSRAMQLQATPIDEIIVTGAPPPALGGAIVPGTYLLSELDFYGVLPGGAQDGVTGNAGRSTLVITADTIQVIGSRGPSSGPLPADTVVGSNYQIMGTSLVTRSVCPVNGTMKTLPYSAVGGGLALQVDANHREVYTRR